MLRWLFGRKSPPEAIKAYEDPFALQLLQGKWQCATCSEWHSGLMDIGCRAPDPWPHARDFAPNSALDLDGDFLSEDFCVIGGEHFLIRCVLEIPVIGLGANWGYGCWSSLKKENFQKYLTDFDSGHRGHAEPWFGWLCNELKIYYEDSDYIAVDVCPQPNRQRPRLYVKDADHPLAVAQSEGITPEAMLDLLRACGHGPTVQ